MNNVARRAMAYGLKRGNVVALSIDEPLLHVAVILGLTQVGIVPVSVGDAQAAGRIEDRRRNQKHELSVRCAEANICHWIIPGSPATAHRSRLRRPAAPQARKFAGSC